MIEIEQTNARIKHVEIGFEDHNIFTCMVALELASGETIHFGGYRLAAGNALDRARQPNYAGAFLCELLDVAGCRVLADLKGSPVRVRIGKRSGRVEALGHFLKERWFYPSKMMEAMQRAYTRMEEIAAIDTSHIPEATAEFFENAEVGKLEPKGEDDGN